ncbi:PIG-L family deacetylase [Parasporobacterium paucivorans]|uniref:GlcNAc-PI de-N-acetylase n=1 Tax=Parasporobacterium paucivorans DSM 15970 TaxID=1122934 RepID=A0A1M6D1C7_9FIRM|nr:PIG-L family deacetylase [Parasporobacterium paucivorans]SHI66911.1 GlcNAc-PI de-N-acetylase [Parasporobacterium paucivorans DSM 15970]
MKKHKNRRIEKLFIFILCIAVSIPYLFLDDCSYGNDFSNSIYGLQFLKEKRAMVIVPHEDDEIMVTGALIRTLIDAGNEVVVLYTTNGDKHGLSEVRINEAVSSLKTLGVKEENVIFLGYGDTWDTIYKHIYNAPENEVITSYIGKNATYGTASYNDFSFDFYGSHSLYTRNNYKKNLKDAILRTHPDILISVDFDSHPDHRAASLFFEEVMCEILKENEQYTPLVYKGFAYNTSWKAKDDFYNINMESTVLPDKAKVLNSIYRLDIPSYEWENRVRFPVPNEMLSYTKRSNLIFEALTKHKSQNAKAKAGKIINSDQVFWERDTKSITYNSKIITSSGESKYLNDFKLIDCSDITERNAEFDHCIWLPEKSDTEKSAKVIFDRPEDISSVVLYDNFGPEDNILKGQLVFSDGSQIDTGPLKKNGEPTRIDFPTKKDIEYVQFKINEYEGSQPGLCELEVFENSRATTPSFIKIMLDNTAQTFIYKYILTNEKKIQLRVYSYPAIEHGDSSGVYKFSVIGNNGQGITIDGNTLEISDNIRAGKYKVRVELINNPEIFDQVEFVVPTRLELLKIKGLMKYEMFIDFVQEKWRSVQRQADH